MNFLSSSFVFTLIRRKLMTKINYTDKLILKGSVTHFES